MYRLSVPPAHYPFFEIVQGYLNKAADVIGLYLKPPANAAVFCIDEKTAIIRLANANVPLGLQ